MSNSFNQIKDINKSIQSLEQMNSNILIHLSPKKNVTFSDHSKQQSKQNDLRTNFTDNEESSVYTYDFRDNADKKEDLTLMKTAKNIFYNSNLFAELKRNNLISGFE